MLQSDRQIMKLLVINPNFGQATTERLQHFIGQTLLELNAGVSFSCITAKFGFPYIASEESYAVATHAVLETWRTYKEQCAEGEVLSAACQKAASANVKSIILGGAGLAGYAKQIQPFVSVPVIDSVEAGVRQSLRPL
jgi:Asp/Glu/hydantoin racemase